MAATRRTLKKRSTTKHRNVLGLMAGTSGDGIDAACVRITGVGASMRVKLLWHRHRRFAPQLRRRLLLAMAPAETTTQELAQLHADLGDAFGNAAQRAIEAAPPSQRPILIGLAGQTVCHLPRAQGRTATLQLGEPARVAVITNCPTVADFRQSDVAAGGQGAPLVPWTDWVLLTHRTRARAIQNIGGIGNVTWLPPSAQADDVIAFDTGPGNMVIDALVAHVTKGRQSFDRNGRRAARGQVLNDVLAEWLRHPYFKKRPPKTTGRELFGQPFVASQLPRLRQASRKTDDWIATATALTARSIAHAYRRFLPGLRKVNEINTNRRLTNHRRVGRSPSVSPTSIRTPSLSKVELIVCGGGAHNATLLAMLSVELPHMAVRSMESLGIDTQAKEAMSFAMLAAACQDGVPANLPQVTGATCPAVLGRICRSSVR